MGFEKDKLNREKYANFLTEILKESEKHKRISDSNSLVIAIDSAWGTGKTTFINMWKEKLESLSNESNDNTFNVILYNAWKNDFTNNPLESLIYTIINSQWCDKCISENELKQELIRIAKSLLKNLGKLTLGKFIDITAIEDILKNEDRYTYFENYKQYLEEVDKLKHILEQSAKEIPIIIVIDELDRCKPLFAINLLECIKHIFDIPNVSFVFALDMEQLSHSVKCVYGQDMDASGYLCRFFDYITKMPKPDMLNYIRSLVTDRPLIRDTYFRYIDAYNTEKIKFDSLFYDFAINMNLSLRDVNTIYSNFILFESQELKDVECFEAYSLYLMLLILKYKYPMIYSQIFITGNLNARQEEIFEYYDGNNRLFDVRVFNTISNKQLIDNMSLAICAYNKKVTLSSVDFEKMYYKHNNYGRILGENITFMANISNVLFYNDIVKWEEIKNKTLSKYIQEKLEFFNFEWDNKTENGEVKELQNEL